MTLSRGITEADASPPLPFMIVPLFSTRREMRVVCGLLLDDFTWIYVNMLSLLCGHFGPLCMCVFIYVRLILKDPAAVSLRSQPALLWDVHPDGHYHEQHCTGSWGPRASKRTTQQRESDQRPDFINKHLEHTGCQTHNHTHQCLYDNVHAQVSTWRFCTEARDILLVQQLIHSNWLRSPC